jgi:hypothetical protein
MTTKNNIMPSMALVDVTKKGIRHGNKLMLNPTDVKLPYI